MGALGTLWLLHVRLEATLSSTVRSDNPVKLRRRVANAAQGLGGERRREGDTLVFVLE